MQQLDNEADLPTYKKSRENLRSKYSEESPSLMVRPLSQINRAPHREGCLNHRFYHGKGELQTATFPTILELFLSTHSGHIPHEPLVVPAEVGYLGAA